MLSGLVIGIVLIAGLIVTKGSTKTVAVPGPTVLVTPSPAATVTATPQPPTVIVQPAPPPVVVTVPRYRLLLLRYMFIRLPLPHLLYGDITSLVPGFTIRRTFVPHRIRLVKLLDKYSLVITFRLFAL